MATTASLPNSTIRAKRPKRKSSAPTDRDYVDNEKFTTAVVDYATAYKRAKAAGTELPKQSNYIGSCVLKIAEKVMSSYNFSRYSFRNEMVSDSVLNCVKYLHNFDENKTRNAFSYVTTICWYSAVQRIKREKQQQDIKTKIILNSGIIDAIADHQGADDDGQSGNYLKYLIDSLDQKAAEAAKFSTADDEDEIVVDNFHGGDVPEEAPRTDRRRTAVDLMPTSIEDLVDNNDE